MSLVGSLRVFRQFLNHVTVTVSAWLLLTLPDQPWSIFNDKLSMTSCTCLVLVVSLYSSLLTVGQVIASRVASTTRVTTVGSTKSTTCS
jgi:hypothetical protein